MQGTFQAIRMSVELRRVFLGWQNWLEMRGLEGLAGPVMVVDSPFWQTYLGWERFEHTL